jgi:uncharacterized protein
MKSSQPFIDQTKIAAPVRGFIHRPAKAPANALVLTHGAGSNCNAPLLVALAQAFCKSGWMVLRCDLPFRQKRPQGPPARGGGESDQAGLRVAIEALRRESPAQIFVGGHSYGGRQASMLAASDPRVADALLLLSYPLHPPNRPDVMRTAHLPNLRTPALFVHGINDGFGTVAEMETALQLIPARTALLPIPGAGHELLTVRNRRALAGQVTQTFQAFVSAPLSPQA